MSPKVPAWAVFAVLVAAPSLYAAASGPSPVGGSAPVGPNNPGHDLRVAIDTAWTLMAAFLIFWMNAGFALLESGFCRPKNCVNILAKNFIVFAAATVAFWVVGWGLMFGDGNRFVGTSGLFFVSGADNSPALSAAAAAANPFSGEVYKGVYQALSSTPIPLLAKFFFQLVFAGTAATIVSGAVAERIRFRSFFLFSLLLVALVYPVTGHWIWGGGFLAANNFRDFAGSSVVHSVGGWAALTGTLVLGARTGRYTSHGVTPIPAHNMTSTTLGVFILWFGWFGFNCGSTMAMNPAAVSHIAVVTVLGGATGALGAMLASWFFLGKTEMSMVLNGCLAGLVAITAGCAFVRPDSGIWIGLIAGILVVLAVGFFDNRKIDDPVGALSVHLVNGIWGTLALGVFYDNEVAKTVAGTATGLTRGEQFLIQLGGVAAVGLFTFIATWILWNCINEFMGLRVSVQQELQGLDDEEHGSAAYPYFAEAIPPDDTQNGPPQTMSAEIKEQLRLLRARGGTIHDAFVFLFAEGQPMQVVFEKDDTLYRKPVKFLTDNLPDISKSVPNLVQGRKLVSHDVMFRYNTMTVYLVRMKIGYLVAIVAANGSNMNMIRVLCKNAVQNIDP